MPTYLTFRCSAWATYNIVINHVFEHAHTATESYGQSFAKMQAATACNHSAGSMLATFLSGGLNHQIEHHMFPSLAVHHFPLIAKDMEKIMHKHGLDYNNLRYDWQPLTTRRWSLRSYGGGHWCGATSVGMQLRVC